MAKHDNSLQYINISLQYYYNVLRNIVDTTTMHLRYDYDTTTIRLRYNYKASSMHRIHILQTPHIGPG